MFTESVIYICFVIGIASAGGEEDVSLVVAWNKRIDKIQLKDGYNYNKTAVVPVTHHSVALAVNTRTKEIFWSDGVLHKIFRASLEDTTSTETVAVDNIEVVDGMAIDWVSNNLYWTDTGKDTIEVMDLDTNFTVVLINMNLKEPRAIVLHLEEKKMFWTDWGSDPKIETADLDGSERRAIIRTGLGWPNGLTVAYDERRLYWIDGKLERIESCNFDGTDRREIKNNVNQGFGIAEHGPHLYYSDWTTRTVIRIDKNNGSNNKILEFASNFLGEKPMALQVFLPSVKKLPEMFCSKHNPCSQICLDNHKNYTCFCSMGYSLQSDGHTCDNRDFILTAWRTSIVQVQEIVPVSTKILRKEHSSVVAIDFLHSKGLIFWSNIDDSTINQAELKTIQSKKVIAENVGTADGIAVDWVCNNLYWTDTMKDTIEVQSLKTGARKVLYSDGLDEPRAIVIYPPEGKMFLTDWGTLPHIEWAALDGSERKDLITTGLTWPNGLAIDRKEERLYWVDGSRPFISSCKLDGSDRHVVTTIGSSQQPFGIALDDNRIFYSEWHTDSIYKISRDNLNKIEKIMTGTVDPMGIKIYNSSLQPDYNNPCKLTKCSHICLPTMQGKSICACPKKEKLGADGTTCVPDINELEGDSDIIDVKITNIGKTSVQMQWTQSSNNTFLYYIEFKCLKMVRCDSLSCPEDADSEYFSFFPNITVNDLASGVLYNVSINSFGKIKYSNTFKTLDSNNKIPGYIKDVEVINSTFAAINWQSVADCTPVLYHYKVTKKNDNSKVEEGVSIGTSVTLVQLEPTTEYKAEVRSEINGLVSEGALILNFTTPKSALDEQGIKELTVYKHTRDKIGLRWKIDKKILPENTKLKISYKTDKTKAKYEDQLPMACNAWPDMYCTTLYNLTSRKNYTISVTPILPSAPVVPMTLTAMTKETAPSKPSYLTVTPKSMFSLEIRWGIPEYLNGHLRSFLISIEEVDKFLEDHCCQDFPVMEVEVRSEEPYYENEIAGLQPASTYAISVAAKTVYFGSSQSMTVNTKPPPLKVLYIPNVSWTDVSSHGSKIFSSWIPQSTEDVWQNADEFHALIGGYLLMAVGIDSNHTDSGITDNILNSEIVRLLGPNVFLLAQYYQNGEEINLDNKRDVECKWGEARMSALSEGHRYKLAAIQVAQYNDAYTLDMVVSKELKL